MSTPAPIKCPDGHPATHHHSTSRGEVYACLVCPKSHPTDGYLFIVRNDAAVAADIASAAAARADIQAVRDRRRGKSRP